MATYGDLWGPLGTYGGLWGPKGTYGDLWGPLGPIGTYGALWRPTTRASAGSGGGCLCGSRTGPMCLSVASPGHRQWGPLGAPPLLQGLGLQLLSRPVPHPAVPQAPEQAPAEAATAGIPPPPDPRLDPPPNCPPPRVLTDSSGGGRIRTVGSRPPGTAAAAPAAPQRPSEQAPATPLTPGTPPSTGRRRRGDAGGERGHVAGAPVAGRERDKYRSHVQPDHTQLRPPKPYPPKRQVQLASPAVTGPPAVAAGDRGSDAGGVRGSAPAPRAPFAEVAAGRHRRPWPTPPMCPGSHHHAAPNAAAGGLAPAGPSRHGGGWGGIPGTAVERKRARGRTGQGKGSDTRGQGEAREGRERTARKGVRDKGKGTDTDAGATERDTMVMVDGARTRGQREGKRAPPAGEADTHREEAPIRAVQCISPGIQRMPPHHAHHHSTLYNIDPTRGPLFHSQAPRRQAPRGASRAPAPERAPVPVEQGPRAEPAVGGAERAADPGERAWERDWGAIPDPLGGEALLAVLEFLGWVS